MNFDPTIWAAAILGCSPEQAIARMKAALPDDPSIGRDEAHAGGMNSLRRRASQGDRDAMHTVREIELSFAACDRARDTGTACKVCGPVRTIFRRSV